MMDIRPIEEVPESLSFNFLVSKGDGLIAWTDAPISINELYSDWLIGSSLSRGS